MGAHFYMRNNLCEAFRLVWNVATAGQLALWWCCSRVHLTGGGFWLTFCGGKGYAMKTILQLRVVNGRQSYAILRKEFDFPIPCFPGMLVSDPALHRKESPLEVQQVTLCTEDGTILLVDLKNYVADSAESALQTVEIFKSHGW